MGEKSKTVHILDDFNIGVLFLAHLSYYFLFTHKETTNEQICHCCFIHVVYFKGP